MKKVIVNVEKGKKNFAAHSADLPGCVATGSTMEDIEKNMREAIKSHISLLKEMSFKVPKVLTGEYDIIFKYEPEALLAQYAGIFTKAALERITGVNQRQLWHYASGEKKPREAQRKRIEQGLHKLGKELLSIEL